MTTVPFREVAHDFPDDGEAGEVDMTGFITAFLDAVDAEPPTRQFRFGFGVDSASGCNARPRNRHTVSVPRRM